MNTVLQKVLPALEQDVLDGAMITVEDQRIRRRRLPLSKLEIGRAFIFL